MNYDIKAKEQLQKQSYMFTVSPFLKIFKNYKEQMITKVS